MFKRADSATTGAIGAITGDTEMTQNGASGYGASWVWPTVYPEPGMRTGVMSGRLGGGENFMKGMGGILAYTAGSYPGSKIGNSMSDLYIANPSNEAKERANTQGDWWSSRTKDPRQKELEAADAMSWSLLSQGTDKLANESGKALWNTGKKAWNSVVDGVSSIASYPGPIRSLYSIFGTTPEMRAQNYKFQNTDVDTPILTQAGEKIGDDINGLRNIYGYWDRYRNDPEFHDRVNDNIAAAKSVVGANKDYLLAYGTPYLAQQMWNTARNAWGGFDEAVIQPAERTVGLSPDRRWKDYTGDGMPKNPLLRISRLPLAVNYTDAENRAAQAYVNEKNNPISKLDRFLLPAEAIGSHIVESFKEGRKNGVWAGLKTYFSNPKKNFTVPKDVYQGTLAPLNLSDTKAVIKGTTLQPIENIPEDVKQYIGSFVPYVAPTVDEYMAKSKPYADLMLRTGMLPKKNYDAFYDTWNAIKENPDSAEELYDSAVRTFKDKKKQYSDDPIAQNLLRILFNNVNR